MYPCFTTACHAPVPLRTPIDFIFLLSPKYLTFPLAAPQVPRSFTVPDYGLSHLPAIDVLSKSYPTFQTQSISSSSQAAMYC